MDLNEKFGQLRWDWLQSIGKARYVRRCIFTGGLFGAGVMYPWLAGAELVLCSHIIGFSFPDWPGFLAALTSGAIGGWVFGTMMWKIHQRKYRAPSNPPSV